MGRRKAWKRDPMPSKRDAAKAMSVEEALKQQREKSSGEASTAVPIVLTPPPILNIRGLVWSESKQRYFKKRRAATSERLEDSLKKEAGPKAALVPMGVVQLILRRESSMMHCGIGAGALIADEYCSRRIQKVLITNNKGGAAETTNAVSTMDGLRGGCAEGLLNQLKIKREESDDEF